MLAVEFNFGRFSGEDIKTLVEPLTVLISRIGALGFICYLEG